MSEVEDWAPWAVALRGKHPGRRAQIIEGIALLVAEVERMDRRGQ